MRYHIIDIQHNPADPISRAWYPASVEDPQAPTGGTRAEHVEGPLLWSGPADGAWALYGGTVEMLVPLTCPSLDAATEAAERILGGLGWTARRSI